MNISDEEWQKHLEAARARMNKRPTRREIIASWTEFYYDRFLWFFAKTWCRLVYCPIKGHRFKMGYGGKCINCLKQWRPNGM